MTSNPRIDELRTRVDSDPKSRHFFPLGEELRKNGALDEAEQVLRDGLAHHPNYLSAWISLGRVLRDQDKHREALEILQRAFNLDGSNVVTARLMAESYLLVGDKIEAIKKFKLVRALLSPDEEIDSIITRLELDLNPAPPSAEPPPVPLPETADASPESLFEAAPVLDEPVVSDERSRQEEDPAEVASNADESPVIVQAPEEDRSALDAHPPSPASAAGELDQEPFGAASLDSEREPSSAQDQQEEPFDVFGSFTPAPSEDESQPQPDDSQTLNSSDAQPEPAEIPTTDASGGSTAAKSEKLRKWLHTVRRNAGVS